MKIKSAIITQASGSVGGFTAAHNQGGLYLRARSIPVNPQTPAQNLVRSFFGGLATRWRQTLTEQQREFWTIYGTTVEYTNPLGDLIRLSGHRDL